eukprot:6197611-Pleurochrysis_carterae.AAC.1
MDWLQLARGRWDRLATFESYLAAQCHAASGRKSSDWLTANCITAAVYLLRGSSLVVDKLCRVFDSAVCAAATQFQFLAARRLPSWRAAAVLARGRRPGAQPRRRTAPRSLKDIGSALVRAVDC